MKRILFIACVACLVTSFTSCEKSYKSGVVTLYGIVVDADTGIPLSVANVNVAGEGRITMQTTVTGSDGTYQTDVTLPAGEEKSFILKITVTKQGYYEECGVFVISRDMVGQSCEHSFTLKKE